MTTNQPRARLFDFMHNQTTSPRIVEFGPYTTEQEASEAFQRTYGYWAEPFGAVDWHGPETVSMSRSMARNND